MALTPTQKVQVRRALGFHSVSQSRYPLVEGFYAVDSVLSDLPAETEAEVGLILAQLALLEGQLATAPERMMASRVGSVGLNGNESADLWREVARWRRELAELLGIPHRRGGCRIVVT